jgi:outer membrane lipoprotein-sorting protein
MKRSEEDRGRSRDARTGTGPAGSGWRDTELGDRLGRLDVPEHGPEFFSALEERLEAEKAGARAAARGVPAAGAARTAAGRRRRAWLTHAWIPIPVAMVIVVLLWAFAGPLGIDSFRPGTAGAPEIAQKAAAALSEAKALRGTLVIVLPGGAEGARDEMRWTFASSADGDFRLTGITRVEDLGYDHRTGVQRAVSGGEGEPSFASEMTGLAAGPPDPGPADYVLERRIGAVVRALLGSPDVAVQEGEYEGRSAWTLSADVQVNRISDTSADHMEVTVDQATGFPVRIVETRGGSFAQETRLEDLEIDPVLGEGAFLVDFPPDVEVIRTDAGFRRVDRAFLAGEAAGLVGYLPVLPAEVPAGFVLTSVAVAEDGQSTGKEGMNPPTPGVVSVMYRRGFDRLIVSTRTVGADPALWSDPLASGEGYIDAPEKVTLASGALAGSTAEILVDMRAVPHLWAMNGALVVTVCGDLTRDELLAVVESLTPVD